MLPSPALHGARWRPSLAHSVSRLTVQLQCVPRGHLFHKASQASRCLNDSWDSTTTCHGNDLNLSPGALWALH